MTVLAAIDSALSGLNAEAAELSAISNNVSNASTVGFKESDVDFESMVLAGSGSSGSVSAGVSPIAVNDITTAGQIQTTGVATDIAINGEGFFVVNTAAAVGQGNYLVTQAGSFRPDAAGNLVNANGLYLQGTPVDSNGNLTTPADTVADLQTVNINSVGVDIAPTTQMTFNANLPSNETGFSASVPTPSATSVNYYDALGNTQSLDFQFTPTTATNPTDPNTNTWTMNIFDSASTTPTVPVGTATLVFNGSGANAGDLSAVTPTAGAYDPAAGTFSVTLADGATLPIDIGALNAAGSMTQLSGTYNTSNISKNGSGYGVLQGVNVTSAGQVVASYTNGATRPIYQLELAMFENPDGLTPASGDAFAMTNQAGVPTLYAAGTGPVGTTEGGALEGSNVDLSTQLTNLIETQRAYSSAATVVKTATDMLDVVNHLSN